MSIYSSKLTSDGRAALRCGFVWRRRISIGLTMAGFGWTFCPHTSFASAWIATRQLQSEKLFMLGPVSIDGLCSAHLSRKSQRHRDLSESCKRKALPHGDSRQVSRNTLAHAAEVRDWRIYQDFAQVLIRNARELYLGDPLQKIVSGFCYLLFLVSALKAAQNQVIKA
jgi:hypothetical protein